MQNVCNYMCPFFLEDGLPDIAGRVHFVQPSCSAAPEEGTDPDYILIYDKDHTPLENPLPLNDEGAFEHQPFVDDGIDFRMIVEAPTGIEDDPWRTIAIIDSKSQSLSVTYSRLETCGTLADLRQTDPAVGNCLVLGYASADDCCPSRVFKWEETLLTENYGTHVRSTLAGKTNAGTWVCEPSGFVDSRWFGLVEGGTAVDLHAASTALDRCYDAHPNMATYVPKGFYSLDASLIFSTLIMEKDVYFVPDASNNITLQIGSLENRGGFFSAVDPTDNSSYRVLPVLSKGKLCTSWLYGSVNEFMTSSVIEHVDEIVFDVIHRQGGASVNLEKKVVKIFDGVTPNNNFTYSDCFILKYSSGMLEATEFHISATGKSLNVDIDGIDIANSTSECGIDATGITSRTTGANYIMTLDYSKIEFKGNGLGGKSTLTGPGLEFYGIGYEAATYDVHGLAITDGSDGSDLGKDALNIDLPNDKYHLSVDKNGFKVVYEPAGVNKYIRLLPDYIYSSNAVNIEKGARYPWSEKHIDQTSPNIDTTLIPDADTGYRYVVVAEHEGYNSTFESAITATPTEGRVIRVVYTCVSDTALTRDWDKAALVLKWNGNVLAILQLGGIVTLEADGSDWAVNYRRI